MKKSFPAIFSLTYTCCLLLVPVLGMLPFSIETITDGQKISQRKENLSYVGLFKETL